MIYRNLAQIYYKLLFIRSYIFTKIYFRKKNNPKNIPIVINNRNRFTFLKKLVDRLHEMGYQNLIILDNDSKYPQLLEYYRTCNCKVIYLGENLGYGALSKIPLFKEIRKSFYVYTDSDVVPCEDCPDDFLNYFLEIFQKYPKIQKVGFSLKIDDIPLYFKDREKVKNWEAKFFVNKVGDIGYLADIDTTFALHRPMSSISVNGWIVGRHIRTKFPYEAYHMPWYNNSKKLTEEEKFYIDHVEIGTHWSKGLGQVNIIEDFYIKKILRKIFNNGK